MAKPITISMPNPCYSDWEKMQPTREGAFCKNCNFHVIDFTKKSGNEVYDILTQSKTKICGRFAEHQLHTPIVRTELKKSFFNWKTIVAGLAALITGQKIFGAAAVPHSGESHSPSFDTRDTASLKKLVPVDSSLVQNDSVKLIMIQGRVLKRIDHYWFMTWKKVVSYKPLWRIPVSLGDSGITVKTDVRGIFKMKVPQNSKSELIIHGGYDHETARIKLSEFSDRKSPKKIILMHRYWMGCPKF